MKTEMELESEILGSQELQVEAQKDEQEEQHFHVLAVDDSHIDRKLLERLLHVSSYKVTLVDSGDKALKYLGLLDDLHDNASPASSESSSSSSSPNSSQQSEGIKVNMIMTDYCMPGMSGYDLLKRVKLQGSSWKDVPVVVMSSENVPSRISMCLEGGAEEFLLKPLQLSDLKKLHPYLVKSINTSPCCCDQQQQSANSSMATNTTDNDDDEDNNGQSNNKSSGISKRKATSPEPPERLKPKTKGFGVAYIEREDKSII